MRYGRTYNIVNYLLLDMKDAEKTIGELIEHKKDRNLFLKSQDTKTIKQNIVPTKPKKKPKPTGINTPKEKSQ